MAKPKEKPGVMLYWEMFDVLETLTDGQAKTMLQAIRNYSQYGELPSFEQDAVLSTLWLLVKPKINADSERYEQIRAQRTAAINARWQKEREKAEEESIRQNTDEYESIRNIPTTTTDTTTDTDTNTNTNTETTTVYKGIRETRKDNGVFPEEKPPIPVPNNYFYNRAVAAGLIKETEEERL